MQESLLNIANRHQSHYERLKTHEVGKFDPFIKKLDADIREVLTKRSIPEFEIKIGRAHV